MADISKTAPMYNPTADVQDKRMADYTHLQDMMTLKNTAMPHFTGPNTGERSFLVNIDASEMVLNGYTLSRENQDKEPWQSNLLDNVSRAKLRGIAAGIGLKIPDMRFGAVNGNGVRSVARAKVFKHITTQTFHKGNPILDNFNEVWQRVAHGVTFSYEGYHTGGAKQKVVESFDSVTGTVKYKEEYVKFEGAPCSILLNPQEFYWADFYKPTIAEQPHLAWVQHYTKKQVETEFSKYPNYTFIPNRGSALTSSQDTTYFKEWGSRVKKDNDYEVFRYYSLDEDVYRVWINGVLVVDAPMLWGGKKKYYPFAKTILEPYANTNFFVGMPFGQMVEAYQDGKNTILNTIIDKLYRSVRPRTLVGLQNKDLFDVQNDITEEDNVLYVPDINAVKSEPTTGVNNAELAMLQVMDRGIENVSISSASQGIPKANITATADQIAAARAAEIKSNLFIYSEDLWLQKTRLRVQTILTHYIKDVAAREYLRDRIINVYNYQFGDGSQGILGIHIAKTPKDLLSVQEIDAREMAAKEQGENYQLISISVDYLDGWDCDFEVISESLQQQDTKKEEQELDSLIQWLVTLNPEFYVANKDKFLQDKLSLNGKNIEEFKPPVALPPPAPTVSPLQQGAQANASVVPALNTPTNATVGR